MQLDDLVLKRLVTALGDPDAAQQIITILKAIVAGSATGSQVITGSLSVSAGSTLTGDVAAGGNLSVASLASLVNLILTGSFKLKRSTVAAAGSSKSDAAALATGFNSVTASNGTKGVILPVMAAGEVAAVVNTVAAQNLKIYPPAGGQIDALGADANLSLATKMAIFICDSAGQIFSMVGA